MTRKKNRGQKNLLEGQLSARYLRRHTTSKAGKPDATTDPNHETPFWTSTYSAEHLSEEETFQRIQEGKLLYCGWGGDCEGCHFFNLIEEISSRVTWGEGVDINGTCKGLPNNSINPNSSNKNIRPNTLAFLKKFEEFKTREFCRDGLPNLSKEELHTFKDLMADAAWKALLTTPPHSDNYTGMNLIETLVTLHDFWIRPLEDWQYLPPSEQATSSLVEHLLLIYPYPEMTTRVLRSPDLKWWLWLVILGQGASIKKVAPTMGWEIPKRFMGHFPSSSEHHSTIDAVRWAEIHRLGGDDIDFIRQSTFMTNLDPTEPASSHPMYQFDKEFWYDTILWMISNKRTLTNETWQAIVPWAGHMNTEGNRIGQRFRWRKRTVNASLRAAQLYRQEREAREQGSEKDKWEAKGWDYEFNAVGMGHCSITEMTTTTELVQEGRTMHHCVGGYAWECRAGKLAIFSMLLNGTRVLTIEVDVLQKRIVQIRGKFNRPATDEELDVIEEWKKQIVEHKKAVPYVIQGEQP